MFLGAFGTRPASSTPRIGKKIRLHLRHTTHVSLHRQPTWTRRSDDCCSTQSTQFYILSLFPLFSSCLTCAFRAYLYTKTRMVFPNFLNLDAYQHRRRRTAGRPVYICKISTLLINSWFACCFLDAIKNARQLQYFHDRDDYINGRGLCAFRISLLIAEVDYTFRTKGFRIICV